jgi:hypothetical protein
MTETLKHIGAFLLIATLLGGFAALVTWHHFERQRLCPGYTDYQACLAMGE